jgi:hypothetical protein
MQLPESVRARCARLVFVAITAGAVAGCAQQPAYQAHPPVARAGTIESIRQVDKQKYASGAGAIVGRPRRHRPWQSRRRRLRQDRRDDRRRCRRRGRR